jgi:quercetin dioxygenase-like cupin family protein
MKASGFTVIHSNPTVPASNSTRPPLRPVNVFPEPQASGTLFGTIDFARHSKTALHRILSLDYCVVLSGSIWLPLDGGEETEIKTGETVVQ